MKFVKQFLIILGISFAGEALKFLLPFPIPASIYGMVILLIVGLMASWHILQPFLVPVSIITVAALITVMIVTGRCTQWILHKDRKKASTNE